MRDVLAKMRECVKDEKMRDFPHYCEMVDTNALVNMRYCVGGPTEEPIL